MNITKYNKLFLIISLIALILGIASLLIYGVNLSIDFTGGSVFKYDLTKVAKDKDSIKDVIKGIFSDQKADVEQISFEADNVLVVKTKSLEVAHADTIKKAILEKYTDISQISSETIGPSIGMETTKKSFLAIMAAAICILIYIAYAFRNIPKPYSSFRFGACAVLAMLHDALIVLGVFSILGHFFNVEIDSLFITALLTVIGFSVHDTIVVFDRIRENLTKLPASNGFEKIVNYSIVETLNRSFATTLTVLITLLALFLLGGDTIRYFVLAMLIGITSGTYSSIFTASPLLTLWENSRKK